MRSAGRLGGRHHPRRSADARRFPGATRSVDGKAQTEITTVLDAVRAGEPGAKARLIEIVYADLRAAAGRLMRRERLDHTLQPTALVNESLMRLMHTSTLREITDRGHLVAAATVAFKRVLIDHARARATEKRGGSRRREALTEVLEQESIPTPPPAPPSPEAGATDDVSPFEAILAWYDENGLDILALDEALDELRGMEQRWFDVILLRFFGGFTIEQTADLMGVSPRTVAQDWNHARAWLRVRLDDQGGRDEDDPKPRATEAGEGSVPRREPPRG